jgi:hypothetical protein
MNLISEVFLIEKLIKNSDVEMFTTELLFKINISRDNISYRPCCLRTSIEKIS